MRWLDRLRWFAGWDLFLQVVALLVLVALGLAVLVSDQCSGAQAGAAPRTAIEGGITDGPPQLGDE